MRLIDADALFCGKLLAVNIKNPMETVEDLMNRINNAPTIDAEPVRHGRWEDGKCTVCNFDIRGLTDGESDLEQWVWVEGLPLCPNCGAKMGVDNG